MPNHDHDDRIDSDAPKRLFGDLDADPFDPGVAYISDYYYDIGGYRQATSLVVDYATREPVTGRDRDWLCFPILFLYRHAIELQLKELILRGEEPYAGRRDFRRFSTIPSILRSDPNRASRGPPIPYRLVGLLGCKTCDHSDEADSGGRNSGRVESLGGRSAPWC